jgi:hypothetical protein
MRRPYGHRPGGSIQKPLVNQWFTSRALARYRRVADVPL